MSSFRDLVVYKKAFKLAMEIFEITKNFPLEEKFELTSQIRKSLRSVCSSLGEAYRKRLYPAHFISKISDADMENSVTQVWLDFALECKYLIKSRYNDMIKDNEEIGKILNHNPDKFK
ncbi:MAG TPA: four helix bundle protein [Ignavibacteriaceae bacterium]|nr:four helix bundle protein [Ignavibacteriaceae bacterium]